MVKTIRFASRSAILAVLLTAALGIFASAAYAYNDGILESYESITTTGTVTSPEAVVDNNTANGAVLGAYSSILIKLDQPYIISSFKYNGAHVSGLNIRFYEQPSDTMPFRSYSSLSVTNDVHLTTPDAGSPIRLIRIDNETGNSRNVAEIELYGSPAYPVGTPVVTATGGDGVVNLSWTEVDDAKRYYIHRGVSSEGPFDQLDIVTGTTYADTDVTNGNTYYYLVTPDNDAGWGTTSDIASATPVHIPRALLNVYMVNGMNREYDLTLSQANAFVNWFDVRSTGIGPAFYFFTIDDPEDEYIIRKEYLVFDKIVLYEVLEY